MQPPTFSNVPKNLFRYFKTKPEIIRLAVMMCLRFPLPLRNVEDLFHDRVIKVSRGAGKRRRVCIKMTTRRELSS